MIEITSEIGCEGVDCSYVTRNRAQWRVLANTVMNPQLPQKAEHFLTSWVTISFPNISVTWRQSSHLILYTYCV
jgi:hypothetical protein